MRLLIATNPVSDSSLPYLMLVPIGDGLVFRTKGTWPRTSALYGHPVPRHEWPAKPVTGPEPFGAVAFPRGRLDGLPQHAGQHAAPDSVTEAGVLEQRVRVVQVALGGQAERSYDDLGLATATHGQDCRRVGQPTGGLGQPVIVGEHDDLTGAGQVVEHLR